MILKHDPDNETRTPGQAFADDLADAGRIMIIDQPAAQE